MLLFIGAEFMKDFVEVDDDLVTPEGVTVDVLTLLFETPPLCPPLLNACLNILTNCCAIFFKLCLKALPFPFFTAFF